MGSGALNPYAKQQKEYLRTQIQTASKEQLVLMLMDGVIRFSEQGRAAIESGDIEKKQFALVRSQDIVIELVNGLDHEQGGEIATNLARLYSYSIRRLVDANLKNDTTGIDEVQNIFRNLREAWAVAMDKAGKEKADGQPPVIEKSAKPVPVALSPVAAASVAATPPASPAGKGAALARPIPAAAKPPADRPRLSIQG